MVDGRAVAACWQPSVQQFVRFKDAKRAAGALDGCLQGADVWCRDAAVGQVEVKGVSGVARNEESIITPA